MNKDENDLMQELQSLWDWQEERIVDLAARPEAQPLGLDLRQCVTFTALEKPAHSQRHLWRYAAAVAAVVLAVGLWFFLSKPLVEGPVVAQLPQPAPSQPVAPAQPQEAAQPTSVVPAVEPAPVVTPVLPAVKPQPARRPVVVPLAKPWVQESPASQSTLQPPLESHDDLLAHNEPSQDNPALFDTLLLAQEEDDDEVTPTRARLPEEERIRAIQFHSSGKDSSQRTPLKALKVIREKLRRDQRYNDSIAIKIYQETKRSDPYWMHEEKYETNDVYIYTPRQTH